MYNFALAFLICGTAHVIGELVSTATKAWMNQPFRMARSFKLKSR